MLGPDTMDPLLILGVVLVAGSAGGWTAARIGVPRITGNIFAGVLMTATIFREIEVVRLLQPLSTFAISLIAVTAGGHFSYRRLHNAMRRILFIAVFEVAFAVILVFFTLSMFPVAWPLAQVGPWSSFSVSSRQVLRRRPRLRLFGRIMPRVRR